MEIGFLKKEDQTGILHPASPFEGTTIPIV
jgi:hypothetical protein